MSQERSGSGLDEERVAREVGYVIGRDRTTSVSLCEFTHDQPNLRDAWLQGFSKGRIDRRRHDLAANYQACFYGLAASPDGLFHQWPAH